MTATPPYSVVLFDLDGTIADSAPGIVASLTETITELGLPLPSPAELLEWVGPPLPDSFTAKLGLTGDALEAAMKAHRARYFTKGALDSEVFPGMADILRRTHEAGIPSSLATSKPEAPATLMLDHFGLSQYLDVITGASADEVRSAKADVVEEALRRLTERGIDVSRPVLIGDRHHDVEGAAEHGVPVIFAEWGYGSRAEQAGAIAVATTPGDLVELLGLPAEPAA
ncbi:HAD hydrolase-like protein [Frondihabitans australicus]|uniref:Phosphoglycolate phosphatase n=1 Tax=Frondihabitans australicus TaxID=386892 RepID=A0A495IID5_9MICO|nr:HAD hydrolase-like protein [Frondihabitans australicus]RKR75753.1 phosphoglycolate phosphatase [Frondihabitans australicus]